MRYVSLAKGKPRRECAARLVPKDPEHLAGGAWYVFPVPLGCFQLMIAQTSGQAGKSGQLAALIQQRIRHIYQRQRPTPLPSRTAKSRHPSQLGVDGLEVAHVRSLGRPSGASTSVRQLM